LRGGELVLTTGVALPDDGPALARYVADLAGVGAAGLVIELVRHWSDRLPAALVEAAERHELPLITLSRETRYVAVTEAVNGLIVDAQVAELRAAERVHETFTALTVASAEPRVVLGEVARITERPVVLETLSHEVLAYDAAGTGPAELLTGWPSRTRVVQVGERTAYHPGSGWLVTVVGARGHDWGRLVVVCDDPPPHRHRVVAERAASALVATVETDVRVLIALSAEANADTVLHRLASDIHEAKTSAHALIGVGTTVTCAADAGRTLQEAAQVAAAALGSGVERPLHRL